MKRHRWVGAALLIPVMAVVLMAAAGPRPSPWRADAKIIDNTAVFDANSLLMFVSNVGSFAYDASSFLGKNDGLYFPQGTNKTVIFAAGFWMGTKVDGEIRGAAAEYSNDYVPGPMDKGTYQSDRGRFRVYKIHLGDTRESNGDYRDWPFDDGAPALKNSAGGDSLDLDGNRIPLLQGDQALWTVYNDANFALHESDPGSGSAGPLGVEVQQYIWGYARSGALGQTIFMRFKIINKGSSRLDSTFVSLWADPDLGDASDDLVGCDTMLSLGFCYNSGEDAIYGEAAPAVGFDFFQGPIVPGASGDSAWVSGKGTYIHGYRNLPMTSFNKYINGTDPQSNIETYNYMLGLDKLGNVQVDPTTNDTTTNMLTGDPVAGTGWLDDNAADRRWMMSSGPFTMSPGDTQEVVAAVLVGQGESRLASITTLKQIDLTAQSVFDLNFNIPGPPPQVTVWTIPHDGAVQLLWGPEADDNVQYGYGPIDTATGERPIIQTMLMEGFNIYQGASSSGPWTKIETFDVIDEVERIYNDADNPVGKERVVVQRGTDAGLTHELWITQDRVRSGGLVNNRPYYFSVTAYNYDDQNQVPYQIGPNVFGIISQSFENLPSAPREGVAPRSETGVLADTAERVAGKTDGLVLMDFVDQNAVTGDQYRVTFNADISWNLRNLTEGIDLLTNESAPIATQVVDGMVIRVKNPPPGIGGWDIPSGKRQFTWSGGDGFALEGFNGAMGWESACHFFGVCDDYGVSSDKIVNVLLKLAKTDKDGNFSSSDPNVSYAYRYLRNATLPPADPSFEPFIKDNSANYALQDFAKTVPLSAWDVESNPPRRLVVAFQENNTAITAANGSQGGMVDGKWWPPLTGTGNNTAGDGPREWLWIFLDDYSETPKPEYSTPLRTTPLPGMYLSTAARRNDAGWSLDSSGGDQFRILANHIIQPNDIFEFTTAKPGTVEGTAIANAVANVHAVPNPYYNVNELEKDQFGRILKFVNLPAAQTTIRIFNLAGDLVRTLVKDDPARAEIVWDVLTETGLPVASGLYIYHVEAEGIGTKIGKVAVFTEVEQLNTY